MRLTEALETFKVGKTSNIPWDKTLSTIPLSIRFDALRQIAKVVAEANPTDPFTPARAIANCKSGAGLYSN